MKLFHKKRAFLAITMVLTMLLSACNSSEPLPVPTVQTLQTETAFAETTSSYVTETITEGADDAPFIPYTISIPLSTYQIRCLKE